MKKILLLPILTFYIVFTSCETTDFTETEVTTPSPVIVDSLSQQRIMLETFGGQGCGNCPSADVLAQQLKSTYGDQVVLVNIHAGYFSHFGNPFSPGGLTNSNGEEIDSTFDIIVHGNPSGLINRTDYNGNLVVGTYNWNSAISSMTAQTPKMEIDVTPSYDGTTATITADINVRYFSNLSGDYNLVALLKENDVVAPQMNYATAGGNPLYNVPLDSNYVHQNLMRGHFNGTWGDQIVYGTAVAGDNETLSLSIPKDVNWEIEDLDIIVYVYEVATNKVIQVREIALN